MNNFTILGLRDCLTVNVEHLQQLKFNQFLFLHLITVFKVQSISLTFALSTATVVST